MSQQKNNNNNNNKKLTWSCAPIMSASSHQIKISHQYSSISFSNQHFLSFIYYHYQTTKPQPYTVYLQYSHTPSIMSPNPTTSKSYVTPITTQTRTTPFYPYDFHFRCRHITSQTNASFLFYTLLFLTNHKISYQNEPIHYPNPQHSPLS